MRRFDDPSLALDFVRKKTLKKVCMAALLNRLFDSTLLDLTMF